ncbi:hypothetical protein PHLGIDRAFT_121807 [Phlebiopsis gigantea 11061_1 CR5-6]|uniref:Uncharacterized protein n=1 Tax=Phlebiopsis gigantea (strain 11061_1 CR5-6) TaxID=745531 RepID=A0A0C3S1K0_PHLG1|nr:hypothetical protein PHLGIDRAFT_121807 [Phlebiopsis gigantea 11061_1 CR5-6]
MYPLLTVECAALLIESILYGIYAVTFSATLYLLRRRRQSKVLTAVTITMFILSTAHIALLASSLLRHINRGLVDDALEFRDPAFPEPSIQIVLECINCIFGDSIIAWRAWVLWNRSRIVIAIPAVLLTCTLASAVGLCHAVVVAPASGTTLTSGSVFVWGAMSIGLTFITNVWAVVLIAIRFWKHYQLLAVHEDISGRTYISERIPVYSILLFLVESGALYCCTLIAVAAAFVSHTNGVYIVLDLLAQFTGIYPTLIVVLVCLQMTQRDAVDRLERGTASGSLPTIVFAAHSGGVLTSGVSALGGFLREDDRGKDIRLVA